MEKIAASELMRGAGMCMGYMEGQVTEARAIEAESSLALSPSLKCSAWANISIAYFSLLPNRCKMANTAIGCSFLLWICIDTIFKTFTPRTYK
jgi:hypothetical protein